jgi:alpha-L-fucosidase
MNTKPDPSWFHDAKFGLFIHFGLYSIPAGEWHGKKMARNHYSEWIRMQWNWPAPGGISKADYDTLIPQFNPTAFDADFIIREAASAGMKYMVLVTKHHDGFALWHSGVSRYTMDATPSRRDLVAEMTAACRKYGLKVGYYYSHWLDWEYPGGGLPPWPEISGDPPLQQPPDEMYEKYWTEKCLPQVKELIDGYSPDLFWFDSWGDRTEKQLTKDRLDRLVNLIRTTSPQTLINSRIGPSEHFDFQSTDDNAFPNKKLDNLWETSGTMNRSWGYNKFDFDYRSTTFLLRALADNISRNGNFQLNIGPRGDGSLPPAVLRRLRDLGAWTSINQEAVFGTRPVDADEPSWGRIVQKSGKLFLHVYEIPTDRRLELPANLPEFSAANVLETDEAITVEHTADKVFLQLGKTIPDDRISVVVLT